jgi:hypothetical protein
MENRIRVFIVEDSVMLRTRLAVDICAVGDFEIVGTASRGARARFYRRALSGQAFLLHFQRASPNLMPRIEKCDWRRVSGVPTLSWCEA